MAGQKHEIKNCTAKHCPLYHFRIGAKKDETNLPEVKPGMIVEEVTTFTREDFISLQGTMTGRVLQRRPNFKEV